MKFERIIFICVLAVMLITMVSTILINVNKVNKIKQFEETLSAIQKSDREALQSAVNMHLAKIKTENNNKAEPVITAGSINNGKAYATVNGKKYVIDTYSLGISLPTGNWYLESNGTVTRH